MDRLGDALAANVRHIGFKDVGLPLDRLKELANAIKMAGARLYLEVVSLDRESERRSAEAAVELGVDVLMGGTRPEVVLPIIGDTRIRYYPFAGAIAGHPSVLVGTTETLVESAKRLASIEGVHGLDLLAYRFGGNAPNLIREIVAAVEPKPVIVAGSIDRRDRIEAVVEEGAAGLTIGTAVLDGVFPAESEALVDQLHAVQGMIHGALRRPPKGRPLVESQFETGAGASEPKLVQAR